MFGNKRAARQSACGVATNAVPVNRCMERQQACPSIGVWSGNKRAARQIGVWSGNKRARQSAYGARTNAVPASTRVRVDEMSQQ